MERNAGHCIFLPFDSSSCLNYPSGACHKDVSQRGREGAGQLWGWLRVGWEGDEVEEIYLSPTYSPVDPLGFIAAVGSLCLLLLGESQELPSPAYRSDVKAHLVPRLSPSWSPSFPLCPLGFGCTSDLVAFWLFFFIVSLLFLLMLSFFFYLSVVCLDSSNKIRHLMDISIILDSDVL